jgi:hypothetical protein
LFVHRESRLPTLALALFCARRVSDRPIGIAAYSPDRETKVDDPDGRKLIWVAIAGAGPRASRRCIATSTSATIAARDLSSRLCTFGVIMAGEVVAP